MTKQVRIENADTSAHIVQVEVYEKGDGTQADELVETRTLANPADLTELFIYPGRYLVISEAPETAPPQQA
jgi:hypothetical protein